MRAHAYRVVIGAWNPMLCPIWGIRCCDSSDLGAHLQVAEMVVKSQYPGSAKAYLGTEYQGFAIEPQ